jgi:predicted  nucleic acid-binding Zn-ribbon protein
MENVLDLLLKIQSFDDDVESAESRFLKIPQEIARLEKQINARTEELKNSETRIQELKKNNKLKELEIADNEAKINKLNTQTFAVKTNEEYRAILNEIEYLKKCNHEIEDAMISIMEEEEKLKTSINQIRTETQDFVKSNQAKIAALEKESESMKEKKTEARINFDNNFAKLPEDVKELYKRIAKSRGKAVCLISDNTCRGCYANLTHQFLNELKKRNRILVCDNCGRILIYDDSAK